MTRLNLSEACLLELSGELGAHARTQLNAHLKADPRARALYLRLQSDFALLQSDPQPYIPATEKARLSHLIKNAVQRELRAKKRRKHADFRRRFAYGALACLSGIAACLVVTVTLMHAQHEQESQKALAIAHAEESVRDFMNADAENITDVAIASLDHQIGHADDAPPLLYTVEPTGARIRLFEMMNPTPEDESTKGSSGT